MLERTGLTAEQTAASAWVIDRAGRRFSGAAAMNRALTELGGLWLIIACLYDPPPIGLLEDAGYRWFARNRGRIAPLYKRLQQSRKK